jgi:uncharacterized repeat protein (TIGR04138 family)
MQDPEFSEIVDQIRKEDPRYDKRAYLFMRCGLDHTVKEIRKKDQDRVKRTQHVSGPELLDGLRNYALEQYGPMAKLVLNEWGIRRCSDFGDIVFNLIDYNIFSKTDEDKREDFSDIYDFDDAFVKPFQATHRAPPPRHFQSDSHA